MTPTLKKLRYKPGMRVAVLDAPSGFESALSRSKDLTRQKSLSGPLDLVQAFYTRRAHFEKDAARLRDALSPGGILWVCYPKAKALGTDLNRDILRESGAERGLEAVAQVAIDTVWSGLRFKTVRPTREASRPR
jgi:hypothetical protein